MRVEQEDDLLPGRAITLTAVLGVAISIAFGVWSAFLLRAHQREIRPAAAFPERVLPQPTEVNDIEQQDFDVEAQGDGTARAARERLGTYGWVDRRARTVHVPIDRAIELYVARGEGR